MFTTSHHTDAEPVFYVDDLVLPYKLGCYTRISSPKKSRTTHVKKIRKEKSKVTFSVALVTAFLAAKKESLKLEDFPHTDLGRLLERFLLSVGRPSQ